MRDLTFNKPAQKNKGGRPRKAIKRDQQLGVLCTSEERNLIEGKAKIANLSVSEFLRELGLASQVVMRIRSIPAEVLALKGTLNHLAANINQIARKHNSNDEITIIEHAELTMLSRRVKELVTTINSYFR
ncbi:MAG: plasmid mobilization relaxosome protein MobC [Flavobacterium sp.]|nr:MAG: plasmid mobilization relaxosome protein MobC [Flavobacterium sp.]